MSVPAECTGWSDQYPAFLEQRPVDVAVLVIGSGAVLDRKLGDDFHGPCEATARDWYRADVDARLAYLGEHADRVVLVLPAWAEDWSGWVNPPDHRDRTDCGRATLTAAADEATVPIVDLGAHLCPDGRDDCEPVRETDGVHLDRDAAADVLRWLIDEALAA